MSVPNLLIIMSDEQNRNMLGAYGHDRVRTPNIDRLAARGTVFDKAYTNSPICVPARAAFQTGRPTHETGYWDNAIAYDGAMTGWGHRVREAGLRVESIGKLHYRRADDDVGFDRSTLPIYIKDGVGSIMGAIRDPLPARSREQAQATGFAYEAGPGLSTYNKFDMSVSRRACQWLHEAARADDERPWVLFVSFLAPHYPLVVPARYLEMYPLQDLPEPKLDPARGYVRHPWVEVVAQNQTHANGLDDQRARMALAVYLGLCSFVDEQIGHVLDTLETCGLGQNTRVIYTADHGENAGSRGLWGKSVFYEESAAIPLVLAGPDVPVGRRSGTAVSLLDVFPSVVDALDLEARDEDAQLSGRSLFSLGSEADDRERTVLSEYHAVASPTAGFMLRDGRYKYCAYAGGYRSELFDLDADPEEVCDLAEREEFAPVCQRMEGALSRMLDKDTVDRRAKDDQNALVEQFGGRERVLRERIGGGGYTRVPDEIAKEL